MLRWMSHKPESRLPGEVSTTPDMQMIPLWWQRAKEPLDEGERREWKFNIEFQCWISTFNIENLNYLIKINEVIKSLKFNIQKTKIMASGLITSWQVDGEKVNSDRFFFSLGSKITADSDWSHEIKRRSLEEKLWQPRQHIKKQRYHFADKGSCRSM